MPITYDPETGDYIKGAKQKGRTMKLVFDGVVDGIDGKDGKDGKDGEKGDKGDKGEQGIQGIQGVKGDKGERGEKGAKGDKGDKGDKGADGKNGKDGKDGKDGIDGLIPEFRATDDVVEVKIHKDWKKLFEIPKAKTTMRGGGGRKTIFSEFVAWFNPSDITVDEANKQISIVGGSTGDVVGPASATDNALARYDGTTGKLIQNSTVTVVDSGDMTITNTYPWYGLKPSGWGTLFYFQAGVDFAGLTTGNYTLFLNPTGKGFSWNQHSTSRFMIDASTGYLGVNNSSPSAQFHVTASSSTTVGQIITLAASQTAKAFSIQNSSSVDLAYFDASANLFIGNSTSASTSTPTTLNMGGTYADTVTSSKAKWKLYYDGTDIQTYGVGISAGQMNFFKYTGGSYKWYFSDVEKMGLDSDGLITASKTYLTSSFSAGNPIFKITATNDAGTSPYIMEVVTSSGGTMFGLSENSGNNKGVLYGIESIQGMSTIALSSSSVNSGAAINVASSNLTMGWYSAGNYSFIDSYSSVLAINSWQNTDVVISGTTAGAKLQVNTVSASKKGVLIKMAASQTANAFEVQNSSGTTLASIDKNGIIDVAAIWCDGSQVFDTSGGLLDIGSAGGFTQAVLLQGASGSIVKLGGSTSSFPAIKQSGAAITFRLADDSANCDITARDILARALTTSGIITQTVTSGNLNNIIDSPTGLEGGFIFKTNGTNRWQLYNADTIFGIYNYGLAASSLSIDAATNRITIQGAVTINGADLTLTGNPAFACGTITSTNASNNNFILQAGASSEAGIIFKASSTSKWQLYANNADNSFRFYSFDLTKELMQCSSGGTWTFVSGSASAKAMIIKLSSAQSANAWEIQDSSSSTLVYFDSIGQLISARGASFASGSLAVTSTFHTIMWNDGVYGWSASGAVGVTGSSFDTGIARNAAGVMEINTGTKGSYRDLRLRAAYWSRTATATSVSSAGETIIGVTSTASARTITLSTADVDAGRIMYIKDESGAAGTNNITIDTQGSELIDGAASITISVNYGVAKLYSDGTNWYTL